MPILLVAVVVVFLGEGFPKYQKWMLDFPTTFYAVLCFIFYLLVAVNNLVLK